MVKALEELRAKEKESAAAQTATSSSTPPPAGSTSSNAGSSSSCTGHNDNRSSSSAPGRSAIDPIIAGNRIFLDGEYRYFTARSEDLFYAISRLYVNPTLAGPGNPFVQARRRVLLTPGSEAAAGGGRGGRGVTRAAAGNTGQASCGSEREETIWGDDEQEQLDIADTAAGLHPDAEGADYLYFDDLVDDTGERLWPGES
jgi:hypothetical protein